MQQFVAWRQRGWRRLLSGGGLLLLLPALSQAAEVLMSWEYPREIQPRPTFQMEGSTRAGGQQRRWQETLTVQTGAACQAAQTTEATLLTFCAEICLEPGEHRLTVTAVQGTQPSAPSNPVTVTVPSTASLRAGACSRPSVPPSATTPVPSTPPPVADALSPPEAPVEDHDAQIQALQQQMTALLDRQQAEQAALQDTYGQALARGGDPAELRRAFEDVLQRRQQARQRMEQEWAVLFQQYQRLLNP